MNKTLAIDYANFSNRSRYGIIYKELSYEIIGSAMKVYNTLGYDYLEKVYEKALTISLKKKRIFVETQTSIKIEFDRVVIGDYICDKLVDKVAIVEVKAVNNLSKYHVAQLINYLRGANKKLGLLINFGSDKLEYKRVLNKEFKIR